MTQAQAEADLCGLIPEETDARFIAQHLCAYAFTRRFVEGKRVLEIGFGDGYGASYLAEAAREVVAVDMAPGNIARATSKYPRPNLRFQHMDGARLAFPDDSFDVVGSFQVIEHVPEPQLINYLTEIARVLRLDGVCCISTLNLAHNMKPGKPYSKLIYHEKEFTAPELRDLLAKVFPLVEMHGLHLTAAHRLFQRLKRWGLNRLGPESVNPVARFYRRVSVSDFTVTRDMSDACLDLIALVRKALPA